MKNIWLPSDGNIVNQQQSIKKEICLMEKFFAEEFKKPPNMRKDFCHISCPCLKCQKVKL